MSNSVAKPHECTICTRSFISQIGLQNHLWSHLPRERRFDGKPILRSQHVYSTNGVLHTNGDNNSSSNFVCPICSKKISTKGNLKVHLETHRPKGKYGCDICGRMYVCILISNRFSNFIFEYFQVSNNKIEFLAVSKHNRIYSDTRSITAAYSFRATFAGECTRRIRRYAPTASRIQT